MIALLNKEGLVLAVVAGVDEDVVEKEEAELDKDRTMAESQNNRKYEFKMYSFIKYVLSHQS